MSRRSPITAGAAIVAAATVVIVLCAGAPSAEATLIVVPNGTFQNPELADSDFTDTLSNANAVPNWTFTNSANGTITAGVWDPGSLDYTVAGGDNTKLPGTADGGQAGYIFLEQDEPLNPQAMVGELTTTGPLAMIEDSTAYTLTVALGRAKNVPTGDVTIALTAGGFPLADLVIPAGTIAQDNFADYSVTLTTFEDYPFPGFELKARISHAYAGPADASVDIDNVRFEYHTVPEPASAAALAVLVLGAVLPRGRRRKS